MRRSYMIIDGQWGSTGKGLIAGYLAQKWRPDMVVVNFGANAGHTVITKKHIRVMTQILPSAIISDSVKTVLIGPGAIIDPEIFVKEMSRFAVFLKNKKVYIHESACVIHGAHKQKETESLSRISSTCKGVGAAQVDKIMRMSGSIAKHCFESLRPATVVAVEEYTNLLSCCDTLQIESAQGMELGINTSGFFPFCTSRDINVYQVLSDCGIPYGARPEIIVSMRTYPIRVGNAFDKEGNQIGESGPVYSDQRELSWMDMGQKEERTTVTNKVRRVFTWSYINFTKVINVLNPDYVFLNFVNYLDDVIHPMSSKNIRAFVDDKNFFYQRYTNSQKDIIRWLGNGPTVSDVYEVS